MQTQLSPIDSIIPYPKNPRTHSETQVERIAKSIKEFGFNQPIVVDEKNVVLVGHGRLEAAKKLGLREVPTLKLKKLSETQKGAYRVLDNKLQNDSTWDFETLELELKELESNGFELEPWGLDDLLKFNNINPIEYDESIANDVLLYSKFKIEIPISDSITFETELDKILQKFPLAKKEKII